MPLCRFAPVLAAVALLSGCTSVVTGSGRAVSPPSGSTSPSSQPATASASPGPYARTPPATAIGDPATADLCAVVDLAAFRRLGYTAGFDPTQYPPSCSVELQKDGRSEVAISGFATPDAPNEATGRTTRVESGLTVYDYPFDSKYGDCERDLVADGATFKVDAFPASSTTAPVEATDCGGTDAMVTALALAVSQRTVPRLSLATPSLTALDVCALARAADLSSSLPVLAGATLTSQGYGVSCELKPRGAFVFVHVLIDSSATPQQSAPATVSGHRMFASTNNSDSFCSYASVQGRTADGKHEEISVSANAEDAENPPAALCKQTGEALAKVLDTAGLH